MKIAYISPIYFSDVDLSYLSHAQKELDITYFAPIFPHRMKGAAFNITKQFDKFGIFKANTIYQELESFFHLIDPKKFYIINSPAKKMRSVQNILLHLKLTWNLRHYDVIHLTEFPQYYEWWYYFLRKKIVLTVHDPIPHSTVECNTLKTRLNRWLAFRLLSHFIILNQKQKQECIVTNKLQNKNIYDSRLGAYDYLTIYQSHETKQEQYILFFGQIASNKGLDILFPAMKELHKTNPNIKLIVAGKGKYTFSTIEYEQLEYFDIRNRFIPDQELADLIQNAMFVICPYKDATQSGVVMSAYAFNKPVIATNVGGFPEQVLNNQYGLIVPPNDIQSLTLSLKYLCSNTDKIKLFTENIKRSKHTGTHSWSNIVSDMKRYYSSVLKK